MNCDEERAHLLLRRLDYLQQRLEGEFVHLQPNFQSNGAAKSVAMTSILNEAANLHEACFSGQGDKFWPQVRSWGDRQCWDWSEVTVRFTYWPELEVVRPFRIDGQELTIAGRDANNRVKHRGDLATLQEAVEATATAWFFVLEVARESGAYMDCAVADRIQTLFDCFDLVDITNLGHGYEVHRPVPSKVEYPGARGKSERLDGQQAMRNRSTRARGGRD